MGDEARWGRRRGRNTNDQTCMSKAEWPKPLLGGFNYYHASTQHLIDCILEDRDPIVNVEWVRHVIEMMTAAVDSARTGQRYVMTTTLEGLAQPKQTVA